MMWLKFERNVLIASILQCCFFLSVRAFTKCEIINYNWTTEAQDYLESNYVVLELNATNLTPLIAIASFLLLESPNYLPDEDLWPWIYTIMAI